MVDVVSVKPLGGYRLHVRFSNGSEGTHDFSALVRERGSALEPLREEGYFTRVFLELGALTWPNGYDMCPDWLRGEMEAAGELTSMAAGR
ncbi:MAG: DUF2442 domain-containing protein [Xanthobacteraceae bacterium]